MLFTFIRFHSADDATPPPPKKQRKLSTPPVSEHSEDPIASTPQTSSAEKSECEDENRNVAMPTATHETIEDVVMTEAKPSTSAAAADEIECKNIAANKNNESKETKATTSSISPANSSSSEYELHAEKNVERKLLRKIEYILLDIIQYLNELENEHLGISSGSSSQNANTSGTSNASSISNNPIAPTTTASVSTTAPSSTASDRTAEDTHNEEIPTIFAPANDGDSISKTSSEV